MSYQRTILNNSKTEQYFTNINSKKYKYYKDAKTKLNSCPSLNTKCKTQKTSNKTQITKAALYRLSSTYKKKIISMLTTTFGFTRSDIKRKEIQDIAKYLDIIEQVYKDPICNYDTSINKNKPITNIYDFLKEQMTNLDKTGIEQIKVFIDNIKNSFKSNRQNLRILSNINNKTKTNSNKIVEHNMNYDTNLIKLFKKVVETLPDCKKQ